MASLDDAVTIFWYLAIDGNMRQRCARHIPRSGAYAQDTSFIPKRQQGKRHNCFCCYWEITKAAAKAAANVEGEQPGTESEDLFAGDVEARVSVIEGLGCEPDADDANIFASSFEGRAKLG